MLDFNWKSYTKTQYGMIAFYIILLIYHIFCPHMTLKTRNEAGEILSQIFINSNSYYTHYLTLTAIFVLSLTQFGTLLSKERTVNRIKTTLSVFIGLGVLQHIIRFFTKGESICWYTILGILIYGGWYGCYLVNTKLVEYEVRGKSE